MTVPGGPPFAAPDDRDPARTGAGGEGPPGGQPDGQDPWTVQLDAPDPLSTHRTAQEVRPPRRRLAVLVAAGVVAAVTAGGSLAWAAFNGDPGDQPERHLPAATAVMAKVDLDPSGPQKIEAYRFLSKFPGGGDEQDLRKVVYEKLREDQPQLPAWSSVQDWLGDRAGVGFLAEAEAPVFVLQVTDEAEARTDLTAAAPAGSFTVAQGWATVSDSKAHLDAVTAAVAKGTLADDPTFRADLDAIGDGGVASAWVDTARLSELVKKAGLPTSDGLLGLAGDDQFTQRVAVVARFSGGDAEVVARTFGAPLPTAAADAGAGVTALPGDTAAAFSIAGGGESFRDRWTALTKGLGASAEDVVEGARQQTGLDLPGDVAALFGRRLTMALALGPEGLSGMPRIGVRGASDDAALPAALERLLAFTDRSGVPLEKRDVPGGYVLATTREQAEAIVAGGDLGGSRNFRDAVPSTEDAVAVAYVDAQRLSDAAASGDWGDEEGRRALAALRSVGLTVTRTTDGAQMTFRVITR